MIGSNLKKGFKDYAGLNTHMETTRNFIKRLGLTEKIPKTYPKKNRLYLYFIIIFWLLLAILGNGGTLHIIHSRMPTFTPNEFQSYKTDLAYID